MSSTRPVSPCRAKLQINGHVFTCEMPGDREHSSHTAAEIVDGRLTRVRWTIDMPIPMVEVS